MRIAIPRSSAPPPELPIVLETTFTVRSDKEGTPSQLSELINPYRLPMWVDQIRISSVDYASFFSLFTRTSTRIQYGRHWLTNEFVPTGVLAPRWPGDGHVVMRLHKPLYLTPQDLVVPTIRSEVSMTIRFGLVGRLAPMLPTNAKVWVPYVTAFDGASTGAGSTSNQQSKRTDLANPFRVPFSARFFIGLRTDSNTGQDNNNQPPITVRISNHLGRPVVRDPTPFFDLFNIRDQACSINTIVPVGGYFLANVDVNASAAFTAQDFSISMFGYREENIQWGT